MEEDGTEEPLTQEAVSNMRSPPRVGGTMSRGCGLGGEFKGVVHDRASNPER